MPCEIKLTRSYQEPSRPDVCDVSANSHHSHIIFEEIQGYPTAIKLIDISDFSGDRKELLDLCGAYRNKISDIYCDAPKLFSAFVINDNILQLVEEAVEGETMEKLACQGNNPTRWLEKAESFFLPLKDHFTRQKVTIGPYESNFPLDIMLDAKPANIVVRQSTYSDQFIGVPVDFYPPLLKLWSSGKFIHTLTQEEEWRVQYSYGDLEVLLAKFFFETKNTNPKFAGELKTGFVSICNKLDPCGSLSEGIVKKVLDSVHGCPDCPYCSIHK